MKIAILFALLAMGPAWASAEGRAMEQSFLCRGADRSEIIVELWKPSEFGEPVHCIKFDSITGMTPCAPNGGWGLSTKSASGELTEIASDWRTAHKHQGGKVTAISGPRSVRFNAQYGEGVGNNLNYEWKFSLERRTGKAIWAARGAEKREFACEELS